MSAADTPLQPMSRSQRVIASILWAVLVFGMIGVIGLGIWTGARTAQNAKASNAAVKDVVVPGDTGDLPEMYAVPAFSLINQDNKTVTNADLIGHPWVAAFFFTQCAGPCPMMSAKMKKLQSELPDSSVKLVSISVDPTRDTPEVLKTYATKFNADLSRWFFLTGPEADIMDFSHKMYLAAEPAKGDSEIIHSDRLILVDSTGKVRGTYSTTDADKMAELMDDFKKLGKQEN